MDVKEGGKGEYFVQGVGKRNGCDGDVVPLCNFVQDRRYTFLAPGRGVG